MTSFEVTTTSVAREVTLYLALASPSSSRRALPGSIASSPSVRRWIRSGPASGPPQGTIPAHKRASVWTGSGHRSIAPSSSSPFAHRTRRGPAN